MRFSTEPNSHAVNIYNKANEEIGEISDVVIGNGKSVIGVVASVGGFLGLGSSYVVIDPASLAIADDNGTWKAYVDTNKEDLSAAPKFDYDKMKKYDSSRLFLPATTDVLGLAETCARAGREIVAALQCTGRYVSLHEHGLRV